VGRESSLIELDLFADDGTRRALSPGLFLLNEMMIALFIDVPVE